MDKSLLKPKHWPEWLAASVLRLICFLPLDIIVFLASSIGSLSYRVAKRRRYIVSRNLEVCFPELTNIERDKLAKETMSSSIIGAFETCYSWWASDKSLAARVDYEGLELLDQYQTTGRGVLLIGSHFTTLDMAGRLLRLKVDVDSSYQKQSSPVFDYLLLRFRLKRFTHMIEKREMRRLVRLLKSGRCIWFAADQDLGRKYSVFSPFFGHPAATLNSISKILKMTGAKPLYFSHYRSYKKGKTRYLMRITDPFGDELNDDDINNAELMNANLEKAIRVDPAQYMWVHRRFKTRPEVTDPSYYPNISRKRKKK